MRKNDAGLTILEKGDVVRIGSGRVHYLVTLDEIGTGFVNIMSTNTNKTRVVSRDKVNLVQSVQDAAYESGASVEEMTDPETLTEEPVKETSAYAKAVLFALNKFQKHVYAGTVSEKTKGKRRALGRRQKASRKANR